MTLKNEHYYVIVRTDTVQFTIW